MSAKRKKESMKDQRIITVDDSDRELFKIGKELADLIMEEKPIPKELEIRCRETLTRKRKLLKTEHYENRVDISFPRLPLFDYLYVVSLQMGVAFCKIVLRLLHQSDKYHPDDGNNKG